MKDERLSLQKTIGLVGEFHDAFGIKNRTNPIANISDKEILLRYKLMREENEEYLEAAQAGDLTEVADALGDMLYILCGTIQAHGMTDLMDKVFTEIHRSNMSKLDENGQPIYREDGKVMKSSRYFKPNIEAILTEDVAS